MNTRELLEMASLDALGLLDDDERRSFECAFRDAPSTIRSEIRREQERLACDESLLPQVEPPASLRVRVMGAVRDAMRAVQAPAAHSEVIARINPGAWSWRGRVSPVWRAACIGFATATVVLLTAGFQLQREWSSANAASTDGAIAEMITKQIGARFVDVLLSDTSQKVALHAADKDLAGEATILIDPESSTAFLVVRDLPAIQGRYRLVAMDDAGHAGPSITDFVSNGGLVGRPLRLESKQTNSPFAIVRTSARGEIEKPVLISG